VTRKAVIDAAIAELGQPNKGEYWESALLEHAAHPQPALKLAWCGIFTLFCLHKAGLAMRTHWVFGRGYLSGLLRTTDNPKPGDIGYRDQPFQHHFIVESVDDAMVHSIDGNSGTHSTVNRCTHPIGHGCTYYSIAPLLGEVELPSPSSPPPARKRVEPVDVQRAVNNLIMRHAADAGVPKLLATDGIIGPKSTSALEWAQKHLGIPVTGNPDAGTCHALGLS